MAQPFVAGIELGENWSQICCDDGSGRGPVSISLVEGTGKYRIPTESLEKFLKKAMKLTKSYGRLHEAAAVAFAVDDPSGETVRTVKKTAMQIIGIPESRICVLGKSECFCAYVMNQSRDIRRHQSVLFCCANECIETSILIQNPRTSPVMARIEENESFRVPVSGLDREEKDRVFEGLARSVFEGRPVSSVFLVGDGFEERWYEGTLGLICSGGRRVFQGNNLYSKGACYHAMQEAVRAKPYIYIGPDKICYNVGLKVPGSGRKAVYSLLDAGTSWYDAHAGCEALLCDEPVVEFILVPMQGNELMRESIYLDGLPKRPPRATRLAIEVSFKAVDTLSVSIKDLGFGEMFPSSDLCWTEDVELGDLTNVPEG